MKTKVFPLQDGKQGTAFFPEDKDEVISRFAKVGNTQHPANVNGKLVIIQNYFLGVTTKDNKEITLTLTEGMKKALEKTLDLTGKTIVFEDYTHKKYGKLLGAKVKA